MLCTSTGSKLLAGHFSTGWLGTCSCQSHVSLLQKHGRPHLGCERGAHAHTALRSARSSGPPAHSPVPQRGGQQTHQLVELGAARSGRHKGVASAAAKLTDAAAQTLPLALQGCPQAQAAASPSSGRPHFQCYHQWHLMPRLTILLRKPPLAHELVKQHTRQSWNWEIAPSCQQALDCPPPFSDFCPPLPSAAAAGACRWQCRPRCRGAAL